MMNRPTAVLLALLCCLGLYPARAAEPPVLFVEQPIVLYELEDAGYAVAGPFATGATSKGSIAKHRPMRRSSTQSLPISARCART